VSANSFAVGVALAVPEPLEGVLGACRGCGLERQRGPGQRRELVPLREPVLALGGVQLVGERAEGPADQHRQERDNSRDQRRPKKPDLDNCPTSWLRSYREGDMRFFLDNRLSPLFTGPTSK
jgi:hypothetical protein